MHEIESNENNWRAQYSETGEILKKEEVNQRNLHLQKAQNQHPDQFSPFKLRRFQ